MRGTRGAHRSGNALCVAAGCRKAARRAGALTFEEQGGGPKGEHDIIKVDPLLFGDIVLARKETPASYHLAVVVDDAFQDVSW